MDVDHLHAEPTGLESGLGHGIGDIVIFQVEKDLPAFGAHHAHDLGAAAGKELLADLEKTDPVVKPFHPLFGVFEVVHVHGENQALAGRL